MMTTVAPALNYAVRALTTSQREVISAVDFENTCTKLSKATALFLATFAKLQEHNLARLRITFVSEENVFLLSSGQAEEGHLKLTKLSFATNFDLLEFTRKEHMPFQQKLIFSQPSDRQQLEGLLYLACSCFCSLFSRAKPSPFLSGQNVFDSGLYRQYIIQIKEFIQKQKSNFPLLFHPDRSPKQKYQHRCLCLINHICTLDETKNALWKDSHAKLLNILRQILQDAETCADKTALHEQVMGFTKKLTFWMFTEPSFESCWSALLLSLAPHVTPATIQSLPQAALDTYKALQWIIPRTHTNCSTSDLHLLGYLPSKLWSISHANGKISQCIRMPNGTFRTQNEEGNTFSLLPELQSFYNVLQSSKSRFLYLNFMNTKKNGHKYSFEHRKSEALHDAEDEIGETTVTVISLDRNSDFYLAYRAFSDKNAPELKDSSAFKLKFLDHLFDPAGEQPCHWSFQNKKPAALHNHIEHLIEAIHVHYFESCLELSEEMRRVFQELFFIEFADHEVCTEQYDYFTAACQASADRGPSFTALWYLKQLLKQKKHTDLSEIQRLVSMLFANAFLTENRAPHNYHVAIFLDAAERMIEHGSMEFPTAIKQNRN